MSKIKPTLALFLLALSMPIFAADDAKDAKPVSKEIQAKLDEVSKEIAEKAAVTDKHLRADLIAIDREKLVSNKALVKKLDAKVKVATQAGNLELAVALKTKRDDLVAASGLIEGEIVLLRDEKSVVSVTVEKGENGNAAENRKIKSTNWLVGEWVRPNDANHIVITKDNSVHLNGGTATNTGIIKMTNRTTGKIIWKTGQKFPIEVRQNDFYIDGVKANRK